MSRTDGEDVGMRVVALIASVAVLGAGCGVEQAVTDDTGTTPVASEEAQRSADVLSYDAFSDTFHAALLEQSSSGGMPSEERGAFEQWSADALASLTADLGERFAGSAAHPVDPVLFIGTTTDGALERDLVAQLDPPAGTRVQLVAVSTTLAERTATMSAVIAAGVSDVILMTLADRVQLVTDDRTRVERVAEALDLPDLPAAFDGLAAGEAMNVGPVRLVRSSIEISDD